MTEVITTDEWLAWFQELDDIDGEAVAESVEMLEKLGVTVPFPHSSSIKGSKYALRELRTQSKGRPVRTFYVFDATREAVLLVGGDKTGDDRFYKRMVKTAEKVWEQYRLEQGRKT